MKDKIKKFFSREEEIKEPTREKDAKDKINLLQKENEILKSGISQIALEKFKTRRSIRKFSPENIKWKTIYEIIEGALNAPCAGNIQNYQVIVVEDKKKKHELGKIAFQQYWLADAPTILVIVRDNYHLCQLYPDQGEVYAIQNSAAFIENILMLAHFYDLGACWVEAYDNDVLKELLEISPNMTVDAIIPIGYPLESPQISKEPMLQKMFFETYGNKKR